MKKLEINIEKGEHLSFLIQHGKVFMPIKRLIKSNILVDLIKTGKFIGDIEVEKEIAKENYKVTITIEKS